MPRIYCIHFNLRGGFNQFAAQPLLLNTPLPKHAKILHAVFYLYCRSISRKFYLLYYEKQKKYCIIGSTFCFCQFKRTLLMCIFPRFILPYTFDSDSVAQGKKYLMKLQITHENATKVAELIIDFQKVAIQGCYEKQIIFSFFRLQKALEEYRIFAYPLTSQSPQSVIDAAERSLDNLMKCACEVVGLLTPEAQTQLHHQLKVCEEKF